MKVKAKRWLNVDGTWHGPGEAFEVESTAGIANAVEVIAESEPAVKPVQVIEAEKPAEKPEKKPETVKPEQTQAKRRGPRSKA